MGPQYRDLFDDFDQIRADLTGTAQEAKNKPNIPLKEKFRGPNGASYRPENRVLALQLSKGACCPCWADSQKS